LKSFLFYLGKAFQLSALIALPSAIWVGHIGHNEKGAIAIFLSSVFVFFAGYGLTQASSRL